jgi:hypothetical protein
MRKIELPMKSCILLYNNVAGGWPFRDEMTYFCNLHKKSINLQKMRLSGYSMAFYSALRKLCCANMLHWCRVS